MREDSMKSPGGFLHRKNTTCLQADIWGEEQNLFFSQLTLTIAATSPCNDEDGLKGERCQLTGPVCSPIFSFIFTVERVDGDGVSKCLFAHNCSSGLDDLKEMR